MKIIRTAFNVRIPKALKDAIDAACEELDYTRNEVAVAGLSALFGTSDEEIQARQHKLIAFANTMTKDKTKVTQMPPPLKKPDEFTSGMRTRLQQQAKQRLQNGSAPK